MPIVFPNLIIIGVHKAGTTSLYKYLGDHPKIFPSRKKELHYFTPLIYGKELPPIEKYAQYFVGAEGFPIRLEASPSYMYGGEKIIRHINRISSDTKFLIMLREPSKRFVSFYKQMISSLKIDKDETFADFFSKSFNEFKNNNITTSSIYNRSLREGAYADSLEPWLSLGKNRVYVVFLDQLKENPKLLLTKICDWANIRDSFYDNYNFKIENKSLKPQNRFIHSFVYNYYMRHEAFFRKNVLIKSLLKVTYNSINQKEFVIKPEKVVLGSLNKIYSPKNYQLGRLLLKHGYSVENFPEWLSESIA